MNIKLVLLRSGNLIVEVLGLFRTKERARWFIQDNYPEFRPDVCQYSLFQSDLFITIEDVNL